MNDEQIRQLKNGLDHLVAQVATLTEQNVALAQNLNNIADAVAQHRGILELARECAQRQQVTIETINVFAVDVDRKLRALDANDQTLQAELLRQRGELARISGAGAQNDDVN